MTDLTPYYTREGAPIIEAVRELISFTPAKRGDGGEVLFVGTCPRCGGSGRFGPEVVHSGICFECEGRRVTEQRARVYTEGRLEQLNAAAQRKADAARAAALAEEEARIAAAEELVPGFADLFRIARSVIDRDAYYDDATGWDQTNEVWYEVDESDDRRINHLGNLSRRLEDLTHIVWRKSGFTEKSAKFLVSTLTQLCEGWAAIADADREAAEKVASGIAIEEGRQTITGTITATKWQDSPYGSTLKMLVIDGKGLKYWGTVPGGLDGTREDLKGARVRFLATVEASDDPLFGFFKRPTKSEVLEAPNA